MIDPAAVPAAVPVAHVVWPDARRIIRSVFPPIDLFEDIADPADWPLIISAEQKTNPRLMETIGNLDAVPPARRVSGPGASFLMAPLTHFSPDRPSRFSAGAYGLIYLAREYETALFETIHHHERFMAATKEPEGWTSQFRELILQLDAELHDLRGSVAFSAALNPSDYRDAQDLARLLRAANSEGLVYPSQRHPGGECAGLFYPDRASNVIQGRHLDYHWNGKRVDLIRDRSENHIYRVGS